MYKQHVGCDELALSKPSHKKNKKPFSNLKVPFRIFSWALHIFRVAI